MKTLLKYIPRRGLVGCISLAVTLALCSATYGAIYFVVHLPVETMKTATLLLLIATIISGVYYFVFGVVNRTVASRKTKDNE